jgi:hypothetical protein
VLCLAGVVGAPAGSAAAEHAVRVPDMLLSDESIVTRWAYPQRRALVRVSPVPTSTAITRLHLLTENGSPELYVALERHTDARGIIWIRVRIPGRPNGRSGWVPREALGAYHVVHTFLVIDRRKLRATLYRGERPIFRAPIGVGKRTTPTPGGHFWVREKLKDRDPGVYGPFALGTSAYAPRPTGWRGGDVVGLHGTNQPRLIPGRPSHGCVRFRNADITRLYRLVPSGTPVWIV